MAIRFSVLTPSLNQGRFLRANIDSVLAQNDTTRQHIVMDGGSTDETLDVLRACPHVQWRSEPDRGQSHALNKALAAATGDVIGWLNADDVYWPGAFDVVREAFEANPDAGVVFGDCFTIDEAGEPIDCVHTFENGVHSLITFWRGRYRIYQPALFWRREVSDAIGAFDESLHLVMDWDYFVRARAYTRFVHVDRALAGFRRHAAAKTADETVSWYECLAHVPRLLVHLPREEHAGVLASMKRFERWLVEHGYAAPPPRPTAAVAVS